MRAWNRLANVVTRGYLLRGCFIKCHWEWMLLLLVGIVGNGIVVSVIVACEITDKARWNTD